MKKKIIKYIVFSIFATFSFSFPYKIIDTAQIGKMSAGKGSLGLLISCLSLCFSKANWASILLFIFCFFFFFKSDQNNKEKKINFSALALGASASAINIIGFSLYNYSNISSIVSTNPQKLYTILKFSGYLFFFYYAVNYLLEKFHSFNKNLFNFPSKFEKLFFDKYSFLFPFFSILLLWIPYIIIFYPGFVTSDGIKELNSFFGKANFTTMHPVFSVIMMGLPMKIGKLLGSDNLGIFLYTFPQMVLFALIFADSIEITSRMNMPYWIRWTTFLFYSVVSFWPNLGYSLLKDSIFSILILEYTLFLIRIICWGYDSCSFIRKIFAVISMILICLVRHNGITVILFSFFFIFFQKEFSHFKKNLAILFGIPIITLCVFNFLIVPEMHVTKGTPREGFSLMLQQTARSYYYHPEDVSEDDKETLRKFFNIDRISERYYADNIDGIKDLFDPYASFDDYKEFIRIWAKMGLRHPEIYGTAILAGSYAYFYPEREPYRNIYGWFDIENIDYTNKNIFNISFNKKFNNLRNIYIDIVNLLPEIPGFSIVYSIAIYNWILIFLIYYAFYYKKKRKLAALSPAIMLMISCLFTPINGFIRYMFPLIILIPICINYMLYDN